MTPEEMILRNIVENEDIGMRFKLKAMEALKIDNVFDLIEFAKKFNLKVDIDISQDLKTNKEKVYYLLNEEYYKLRDNKFEF
ncbi:hypothetical protein [Nautilia profundicola]|nr:hypothetical protein [Nautilia profundicola]